MNVTKSTKVRTWRQALVLLALLSLPLVPPAFASDFAQIVFFGDSLSDPGNHFIAFGTTAHQPFAPIPDDSYAIGGHHFSNGATWAEQLAQALHIPRSGSPALRAPGVFTNYAVGRARARPDAPVFRFYDLSTQVGLFLSDFGGHASPDNLYVIWIGGNDLRDALETLPSDPSSIIGAAVAAVAANIQALWLAGARTFLIPDVPNPANTPAVRALGPVAQFAATQLTDAHNGALHLALNALQAALPGIHLIRLDVNALFGDLPSELNTEDSCLTFGVIGGAICARPKGYVFWDGVHPTTTGHAIIAEAALEVLAP